MFITYKHLEILGNRGTEKKTLKVLLREREGRREEGTTEAQEICK